MEFLKQEYWSGVPFPSLGHLPDPGIELTSIVSPALSGEFFTIAPTWEACLSTIASCIFGCSSEESTCNAGDTRDAGSVPGLGRHPAEA